MGSESTFLWSVGAWHPEQELGNEFFDQLDIGSDAAWTTERTGISSRRSVMSKELIRALREGAERFEVLRDPSITTIAEMGKRSWDNAWQKLSQEEAQNFHTQLVICGSSIPDYDIPAHAAIIAGELGLRAMALDVQSACSSFVSNLHVVEAFLRSGTYQSGVIFNPERYSLKLDYRERGSAVLFGDGAAATIFSSKPPSKGPYLELLGTWMNSDPTKWSKVQIPSFGLFSQDGPAVQKFAVSKTVEAARTLLAKFAIEVKDIGLFVGHQANLRMLQSAAQKLGLDPSQHRFNVDRYGNQGAAGAPAVLAQNWGDWQVGSYVLVSVVGAGLTWGAALFKAH